MIKILKSTLFLGIFLSFGSILHAQDPHFSQFYANPLYLNPALTGSTQCGRINFNYRNQWPSLSNAFVTYNVSYDQSLPGLNSGIGILVMSDQQGNNALNRTNASGFYSFKFRATDNVDVSLGVRGAYYQEKLNWEKLTFADQIEPTTGNINGSSQETPPASNTVTAVDFSAGALVSYTDKFFVGFAVDHLTQPDISFYEGTGSKLPMKITLHGGATVNLSSGTMGYNNDNDWVLQPNILYMQQEKFHQLNLGLYAAKYPFVVGGWFRHNFQNPDAFIVLAGITYGNFQLGYSYDVTLSSIGGKAGGAHEISFSWRFCIYKEEKRRHIRAIKSPSF